LIAEVSDTSVALDRGRKLRTYARHGIAVYWIVNLIERQVEVYTEPLNPRRGAPVYQTRTDYRPGQKVPVHVAGVVIGSIAVNAVLPPASGR
jgi:Uma2 family endonuclease